MANKRASSPEDPLKPFMIYIPESQLIFLKSLGKSSSGFVRSLIADQMNVHGVEISKLKEERKLHEAAINIIDAQIREYEAESSKQQNTITLKENLFRQQTEDLVKILKSNGGFFSKIEDSIEFRIKGMNEKLNGSGAQPFTVEELKQAVLEKAKAEEVKLYYSRLR